MSTARSRFNSFRVSFRFIALRFHYGFRLLSPCNRYLYTHAVCAPRISYNGHKRIHIYMCTSVYYLYIYIYVNIFKKNFTGRCTNLYLCIVSCQLSVGTPQIIWREAARDSTRRVTATAMHFVACVYGFFLRTYQCLIK